MGISFSYTDGNNNNYRITENLLSYTPVRAIESNSGEYDGGEPKTIDLSPEQFKTIQLAMMDAFEAISEHVVGPGRNKGTAVLSMRYDNERASCMLAFSNSYKIEIEKVLKRLLNLG